MQGHIRMGGAHVVSLHIKLRQQSPQLGYFQGQRILLLLLLQFGDARFCHCAVAKLPAALGYCSLRTRSIVGLAGDRPRIHVSASPSALWHGMGWSQSVCGRVMEEEGVHGVGS